MRRDALKHEFVESAPAKLEEGVLYVSIPYASVLHKCCCGCGSEVVTPLTPTDWQLTFDGETVSLHPSVGNWSLQCQSHYWIDRNKVRWAAHWSPEQIDAGRAADRLAKQRYFGAKAGDDGTTRVVETDAPVARPKQGLWEWAKRWWSRMSG